MSIVAPCLDFVRRRVQGATLRQPPRLHSARSDDTGNGSSTKALSYAGRFGLASHHDFVRSPAPQCCRPRNYPMQFNRGLRASRRGAALVNFVRLA